MLARNYACFHADKIHEQHKIDKRLWRFHLIELLLFCLQHSSCSRAALLPTVLQLDMVFSTSYALSTHASRLHHLYSLPFTVTHREKIRFLNNSAPLRYISNAFINPQVCCRLSTLHLGVWQKER